MLYKFYDVKEFKEELKVAQFKQMHLYEINNLILETGAVFK